MKRCIRDLRTLVMIPLVLLLSAAASYQVNHGQTVDIDEHAVRRCVTNNYASGQAIFVPTNTSTEWSAFRTNAPAGVSVANCTPVTIFLTAGTTWTVPSDWNNADFSIEAIGGGAGGAPSAGATAAGRGGGGGGGYSRVVNGDLTLVPGNTVYIRVGTGGGPNANGGDTWFNRSANAAPGAVSNGVLAKGGSTSALQVGGSGGLAANGVGSTKYSGGSGGNSINAQNRGGGGGGGAAGPNGNGGNGGNSMHSTNNGPGGGGGGANGGANGGNGVSNLVPGR